nr:hypothetical protein [Tanacetum cinerariifolium]
MAFRNFICTEDDEDLTFLLKEPSPGFSTADSGGSPKPELFVVHPEIVAARIKDRKCKTRGGRQGPLQAVVDNAVNRMSHELLQVIDKLRGECDVLMSRERARDEEYEGLRVKCEAVMTNFEKNPAVKWAGYQQSLLNLESTALETEKARLEAIELSPQNEVEELKRIGEKWYQRSCVDGMLNDGASWSIDVDKGKSAISTALGAAATRTIETTIVGGLKYSSNKG